MSGGRFDGWIGRTESVADVAVPGPLERLSALLDHKNPPWPQREVPPLAHWLYFLPCAPQSQIGPDGHPRRGDFLPPIDPPRRMWAGSRVSFLRPLPIGAAVLRRSAIASVTEKSRGGGPMTLVTIRHEISAEGTLAIVEEQDIVYRNVGSPASRPSREAGQPMRAAASREIVLDSIALFRFSALTFNAHRIHYDREYARNVEGYPGLVVQGPFTATLLMDHFLGTNTVARIGTVAIRALRPLFADAPFQLCLAQDGDRVKLWALDPSGREAMAAHLTVEN
jgi:3-methylfumaryl-CoA hydratase